MLVVSWEGKFQKGIHVGGSDESINEVFHFLQAIKMVLVLFSRSLLLWLVSLVVFTKGMREF